MDTEATRDKLDQHLRDLRYTRETLGLATKEMEDLIRLEASAQEALTIVEGVARDLQQQVHQQIASVVTKCLSIFEEPYEFRIVFERKRNQTEARLVFVREGMEVDPLSASGGGVVDVASFALRLACVILARPPRRRTVVLDEPFRFVSREYHPALRKLLESLSEDLGIQFVMITHIDALQTGKVVEL